MGPNANNKIFDIGLTYKKKIFAEAQAACAK
jgi:hypothetical protein